MGEWVIQTPGLSLKRLINAETAETAEVRTSPKMEG